MLRKAFGAFVSLTERGADLILRVHGKKWYTIWPYSTYTGTSVFAGFCKFGALQEEFSLRVAHRAQVPTNFYFVLNTNLQPL